MKVSLTLTVVSIVLFCGCAAKPLLPGAEKVFVSNDAPSADCEFVGEVIGGQGNWWTDDITTTKNVVEGSRNELRNEAFKLGGNYVHVQQANQSTNNYGGSKASVAGNAYECT